MAKVLVFRCFDFPPLGPDVGTEQSEDFVVEVKSKSTFKQNADLYICRVYITVPLSERSILSLSALLAASACRGKLQALMMMRAAVAAAQAVAAAAAMAGNQILN